MGCVCDSIAGKDLEVSPVCLGDLWIFQNLVPDDLHALVDVAVRKKYEKGETIFYQGDSASYMFLIKAGRVKLSKLSEDGYEFTLDLRKSGDFLGESVLDEEMKYPVSAACVEETLTCGFSKAVFERLILERPTIGLQVIRNLSSRIGSLTNRLGDMSLPTLEGRLYRLLINVAKEHGKRSPSGYEIGFPITHEELSFLAGAHRVSVTRAMKGLREAGKLRTEGRMLIVSEETAA